MLLTRLTQKNQNTKQSLFKKSNLNRKIKTIKTKTIKNKRTYTVEKSKDREVKFVSKTGFGIINDPRYNQGTGFSPQERDRLGLRGLIPPSYLDLDGQLDRIMMRYNELTSSLDQFQFLSDLQDRNETLYYYTLMNNIEKLAPVVYTPTVGLACQQFSSMYRKARGMYFSRYDKGQMMSMIYNWPDDKVKIIVVTDGSRILGLGDLGAQGMGIPIGKLALYVAGGGINPFKTLPVTLDLGTDNEELRNVKHYIGVKQPRLTGDEYMEYIDEFIKAVTHRYPNALIQFEDFNTLHAQPILERYKNKILCFNDDIQGTGSVAVAGVLSAVQAKGVPFSELKNERIVIAGAGSAGIGVGYAIVQFLIQELHVPATEAYERIYVVDEKGLLGYGPQRATIAQKPFVRMDHEDGIPLSDVIDTVKPTILLGLSAVGGLFTESMIKSMYSNCERPIIFPMSNPTIKSECTAEQAYQWTEGNCIFASGSPFSRVHLDAKTTKLPSQANNMFIFPGLGLAATSIKAKKISRKMLNKAALALSQTLTQEERDKGYVYPSINRIREVSLQVATAVANEAYETNICRVPEPDDMREFLSSKMWWPTYHNLVLTRNE